MNTIKKKYRKHTESYISGKWKIVVGELVQKDKRKTKYGEDYFLLKLKAANKLTDLYCQIDWRELGQDWGKFEHPGYPYTQHYSFLSIDRCIFDFDCKSKDLEAGNICIFEYYRDNAGFPLLISFKKVEGIKRHLEKMWEAILSEQHRKIFEQVNRQKQNHFNEQRHQKRVGYIVEMDRDLENIKNLETLDRVLTEMEREIEKGYWGIDLQLIVAKHRTKYHQRTKNFFS